MSHDRDFLDGLVDKVYEFGGGQVREHLGGIYDFLRARKIDSLQELERKTPAASASVAAPSGSKQSYEEQKAQAAQRRKLEKQIVETEAEIARLEEEQKVLEQRLNDPQEQTSANFEHYEHIKRLIEQKLYEWEILSNT